MNTGVCLLKIDWYTTSGILWFFYHKYRKEAVIYEKTWVFIHRAWAKPQKMCFIKAMDAELGHMWHCLGFAPGAMLAVFSPEMLEVHATQKIDFWVSFVANMYTALCHSSLFWKVILCIREETEWWASYAVCMEKNWL